MLEIKTSSFDGLVYKKIDGTLVLQKDENGFPIIKEKMAKYKSMLKSELADAAGVSLSTFSAWLRNDQDIMRSLNLSKRAKYLPPCVVRYICEKYAIDLT